MTTVQEVSVIPLETLIEDYREGFKLIPLSKDARTPNVRGLLTSDEEIRSREESPDGQIHPVNYISNHPEFWDENRIKQEHWRFNNVATAFGETHKTDEQGAPLYLNAIDIDSKQVFDNLAIIRFDDKDHYFIDEMYKTTQVTQTKKKWGRHIYWLSHKQYQPYGPRIVKSVMNSKLKQIIQQGFPHYHQVYIEIILNFHYQSDWKKCHISPRWSI